MMGQQQEIEAGSTAVRRVILLLAVAAVLAAMVAATAAPAFAKGGTTNLYTCVDRDTGTGTIITNASQPLKKQFQPAFKCTKQ
jgi:hypothetical protein